MKSMILTLYKLLWFSNFVSSQDLIEIQSTRINYGNNKCTLDLKNSEKMSQFFLEMKRKSDYN